MCPEVLRLAEQLLQRVLKAEVMPALQELQQCSRTHAAALESEWIICLRNKRY